MMSGGVRFDLVRPGAVGLKKGSVPTDRPPAGVRGSSPYAFTARYRLIRGISGATHGSKDSI